jgi:hypothetical protein
MKQIWKFPLEVIGFQSVSMPAGAEIISCQVQNGQICVWAICDTRAEKVYRGFGVYGTGHEFDSFSEHFLGTVQMGSLVFHVFGLRK